MRTSTAFQGGGQFVLLCQSLDSPYRLSLSFLYKGTLPSPHFKQRGSLWPFMCSCSCSFSFSSSFWCCFCVFIGPFFSFPTSKQELCVPWCNVCSSHARHWTALPVVSPASLLPRVAQRAALFYIAPPDHTSLHSSHLGERSTFLSLPPDQRCEQPRCEADSCIAVISLCTPWVRPGTLFDIRAIVVG